MKLSEFISRFERQPNGCLEWTRAKVNKYGHGIIVMDKRRWLTHRLMYTIKVGSIPKGMCVLHKCDNGPCAEPTHLFLGTRADNITDMISKGRGWFNKKIHPNMKLTQKDVDKIRAIYPRLTQRELAIKFNVCQQTIHLIIAGKLWKPYA